jgi:hypothetical protein
MNGVIALLSWNPEIRNILSLSVGLVILIGSVILLLSTNTGPRTGMLIGTAALLGWMMLMGFIWWMYTGSPASLGGMKGTASHWRVVDVNVGDLKQSAVAQATQLPAPDETKVVGEILARHPELEQKVNPDGNPDKIITVGDLVEAQPSLAEEFKLTPDDLAGWHLLTPANPQRGDAQAVADAELIVMKLFKSNAEYKVLEAYDIGGKENDYPVPEHADCGFPNPFNTGCWHRVNNWFATTFHTHPKHFAVVQVKAVIPEPTVPGEAPPIPQINPDAPVVSVVMIRSLGDVRFPGFMIFVVSGILFAITCNTLHRRDKRMAVNRAAAP